MSTQTTETVTGERADLLESLAKHRFFLRHTTQGLTDEQAALRPTASELCLGGLVKHVTEGEEKWASFIVGGPEGSLNDVEGWLSSFEMAPGETLAGLLDRYAEVAARTDEIVRTADLDHSWPLPAAPWFEPGAHWSTRRVLLHLIGEIAQHAGHADIIRETLDGQKSMG